MRLVDTHTHAWGPDTADLPWAAEALPPEWSGPYTHDRLVADMDDASVDEGVLLPTTLYGRGERANEYTLRSVEAHPDRLWGVGVLEYFDDEASLRESMRRTLGHERMLGVRFHACFEYAAVPSEMDRTADWIAADDLAPVWDELAAHDGVAMVLAKPEQFSTVASLADSNPGVEFVLEHLGWPDEDTGPDDDPWTDLRSLAEHDNVSVKISSIPRASGEAWPYENVAGYVRNLLDWFGAERLMLGSDYPWLDSMASMSECLSWPEEADYLSARDLSYLSYRTFDDLRP